MDNNLLNITQIVDYIETHLEDKLDLEKIASEAGYSKYHLHRMFSNIVGFTVHSYVQRRRLTEAARLLIFSNQSIMEIALFAGYKTQQSFSVAFKALFDCSPQVLRKKREFFPLQLKFTVDGKKQLRGDMIMDIKTIESKRFLLVGYTVNTRNGFSVIGECMVQLETNKGNIANRSDEHCLIGINDYTIDYSCENEQPAFDFYGVVEVADFSTVPGGMITKELLQLGDEHRRHAVEYRAALLVNRGQHAQRIEILDHDHRGAVRNDGTQREHTAEAVEQRHADQQFVRRFVSHKLARSLAVVENIAMGEHHALRKSGRAGGVLHIDLVVGLRQAFLVVVQRAVGAGADGYHFGRVVHSAQLRLPQVDHVAQLGELLAPQFSAFREAQFGDDLVHHRHIVAVAVAVDHAHGMHVGIL